MSNKKYENPLRWGIIGCGKICHDFVLAQRLSERPHKV